MTHVSLLSALAKPNRLPIWAKETAPETVGAGIHRDDLAELSAEATIVEDDLQAASSRFTLRLASLGESFLSGRPRQLGDNTVIAGACQGHFVSNFQIRFLGLGGAW